MTRPMLVGMLCCLVGVFLCPLMPAQEPARDLTEEERTKLEQQAKALHKEYVKLNDAGQYAEAAQLAERVLAMRRALYPEAKYPHGHPDLARNLNSLGVLLWSLGEYGRALSYAEQALAMYRALYPEATHPRGHPELAQSLGALDLLLTTLGEYGRALPYAEQALAMYRALYPEATHPRGHPELARSLTNLGGLLHSMEEHGRALPYLERALAMCRALYPEATYPRGHPDLARSLGALGVLLGLLGEYGRALPYAEQALAMHAAHGERLAQTESEARALNYVAELPFVRDVYLSVARHLPNLDPAAYARVWQTKAALTRVYERRHLALAAASSPEVRALWNRLTDLRRQRERLLLLPTSRDSAVRDKRLEELSLEIARLERDLLPLLPPVERAERIARSQPGELQVVMPAGTALIDMLRYGHVEQDPKQPGDKAEKPTPSYVAFVVAKDAIRRVELGEAKAIEEAIGHWREAATAWKGSLPAAGRRALEERAARQAAALHELIWKPVAQHLPPGTQTVYLAPDAALTQVPWAALPGRWPGSVLLEDFALAFVPHGPFLLDKLTTPARPEKRVGALLALGGVAYDERPAPLPDKRVAQRGGMAPGAEKLWTPLAGTEAEHRQVEQLARTAGISASALRATDAGVSRLLAELPRAQYAHLATHGFFADKKFRSMLQLDEKLFERREFITGNIGERIGEGARNPLVLSGLVLAGANLSAEQAGPDRGILTGDAILNLLLDHLELAVLSACETGLGDVAGGEGVFGLQRAFHMAGTHNVIASLWKVDDQPTAALMTLFYRNLWEKKMRPIEALRQAQLALYRHPEGITAWAQGERGIDLSQTKPGSATQPVAEPAAVTGRAPMKHWAAFQLSGLGR